MKEVFFWLGIFFLTIGFTKLIISLVLRRKERNG